MEAREKNAHVSGMEDYYEYTYPEIREQLIEWYKKGIIDDNTQLYAQIDTKYSVNRWNDFINMDLDDLVLMGRAGKRFESLLSGQPITKEILSALREKLKTEVIAEIGKAK